jgi:hypothetical protein
VPVIGSHAAGEPCTISRQEIEPNASLWLDDCDVNSSCRSHVQNGDEGTCLPRCEWNAPEFSCEDPERLCGGGEQPVCWQKCDPVAEPSCEGEFSCDSTSSIPGDPFICQTTSTSAPQAGEGCATTSSCATGLGCLDAAQLPDCDHDIGCCTPLCSLDDVDACAELGLGYACVPYYTQAPAGLEHVGMCGWN